MASEVDSTPTSNETLEPQITRLNKSRPRWSAPRTYPGEKGGDRRLAGWVTLGSRSGRKGASVTTSTTTAPAIAHRLARKRCQDVAGRTPISRRGSASPIACATAWPPLLAIANPRIDVRVQEVCAEIDEHVCRGDQQYAALYQREVACQNGVDHHETDTRPAEYRLDVNCARQQKPRLQPEDGRHRHQNVSKCMLADHRPVGEPLRTGRADVILADHIEHAGPGEPGDDAQRHQGQRGRREDEMHKEVR